MKSNAEKVAQAVRLKADGKTLDQIAAELGVSQTYARLLANPEAYAVHKRKVAARTKANPEKSRKWSREYAKRTHVKEARNARLRERYANDPAYKAKRDEWTLAFNRKLQPKLRQLIRSMTWAVFADHKPIPHGTLAIEAFGKPLDQLRQESGDGESVDHIVPLCRFDLTDTAQFLKAIHWSNVRRIPLHENASRPDSIPDGVTIESLPFVDTPEARWLAEDCIWMAKHRPARA